jgi:hypothetical protein
MLNDKHFFIEHSGETWFNYGAYPPKNQITHFHRIAVEEIQKILDRYFPKTKKSGKPKYQPVIFDLGVKQ